jgi:hypothetical protein
MTHPETTSMRAAVRDRYGAPSVVRIEDVERCCRARGKVVATI